MSRVDLSSAGFSKVLLPNGMLQTDSALNTTLQTVKDNVGNSSTLLLSTVDAQFNSTLRIHTDSSELLDIEDTGANNRFNINRVVQKINLDFSSKPTDTTTVVGAIRTATNGSNLADVFTFLENGTVGLNNPAPSSTYKLDIIGNVNASSYIVTGGTSSQFLKANGSLDSTAYTPQTRTLTINGTAQDLSADRSWTIPTYSPPNGLLRTSNAISSTLQTVTDYLNNTTSLQLNSGRIGILSDSSVTTQTSAVIQATTTNANLVLNPNGTGAIVASIPDGTATGGNARGANAVDLQTTRTANTNVASGTNSTIGGGASNTSSTNYSTIGGGQSNINQNGQFNTISGGSSNNCQGNSSVISGGKSNTAGTYNQDYCTISGGQSNLANSAYSTVAGGFGNSSTNIYSFSSGRSNNSTGQYSVSLNIGNTASNQSTLSTGNGGIAYLFAQRTHGNGGSVNPYGTCIQISELIPYTTAQLATAGTAILSLDGSGSTNLIIPYSNTRAWNVQVNWVAVVIAITGTATGVTVGDTITQIQTLGFKRVGGTSSLVGVTNTLSTNSNTSMSTASMAYTAGASQELALTFTAPTFAGGGTITCRVVARIELTEVAW